MPGQPTPSRKQNHAPLIRFSGPLRYAIGVGIAAGAVIVRRSLDPLWGLELPYITFFPAIMLSAWLGGWGPGLVTTLLTAAAALYFWIEPTGSWAISHFNRLFGLGVFVLVGGLISFLNQTWRVRTAAVLTSEERLSTTLHSIGDAVIATDQGAVVTTINPVAETLTGWPAAEAVGRPLHEVFVIRNEKTGEPALNPVYRVLHEGVISGLANHTILIARDGREIPISDSAAPIRDEQGHLLGVVMVFRDVSERRRLEKERQALLERERTAHAATQHLADELRALQSITDVALSATDSQALVLELLGRLQGALDCDTTSLLLLDRSGSFLTPVASVGLEEELHLDIRVPLGTGIAGRIATSEKPVVIENVTGVDVVSPVLRDRVRSLIGVRLKTGARLLGVIHAGSARPRDFSQTDVRLLSLAADRIAMALERTRLHETERAARGTAEQAVEQLGIALESGQMGTWEYRIRTGQVIWSAGLERIHGYQPGTFPGTFEAFRSEIHPEDRDGVLRAIEEAVRERRNHQIEYRIVRSDGIVRWVEGRGKLFLDSEGVPDRMVGVCSDVTERKRAEDRFRLAVEAAPAAMIMVDRGGTIVLANALTEGLLGGPRDRIVGEPVDRFVPARFRGAHPEHRKNFLAAAHPRPMGAGRDLFAVRLDGSEVPVEIGLSPIETPEGLLILAAITDISERKEVEDERARLLAREQTARVEMERANLLKDEFLAVLSHELRTPLNAVLGYAQLLSTGAVPADRVSHALSAILRNGKAQARLIESLLDLSRIIAGKLELSLEAVDIGSVVEVALDVVRPDAEAKTITLNTTGTQAGTRIIGDGGRLQQVFWNLLSNSVKFTPPGGRIDVSVDRVDDQVEIHVRDSGEGISPEFLPHVFERFKQDESQKRRGSPGLGLGLALVREIVQAHGGTVVAQSPGSGRGSTFTVRLPVPAALPEGVPVRASSTLTGAEGLSKLDILIVDDDREAREFLAALLESRGATARPAVSAKEALDLIGENRPDVLLADIRMPEVDGYSLIQRLRAREREERMPHIPAIAVTADAGVGARELALASGYDGYVAKPVDPQTLVQAILKATRLEMV